MEEQLTLGELIAALKPLDKDKAVRFDFVHFKPHGIHSYRGYYEQIALGYGHDHITVAQLLELCSGALGKTFEGYKGGEFVMHSGTPVWVANHNESGGTAVVAVRDDDWIVTLITESIE